MLLHEDLWSFTSEQPSRLPFFMFFCFYPLHYAKSTFTGLMNVFDNLDLKIRFILS